MSRPIVTTNSNLSTRDAKGLSFEIHIQSLLKEHNIPFEGNPTTPKEWKSCIGQGSDIKLPQLDLEIECKSNYSPVYPSFILRDFIPRFSNSKHKVVVTNDLKMYSSKCKELLKKCGIKLLNPKYLISYLYRLINSIKKPNKHYAHILMKKRSISIVYWFGRVLQAIWTKPTILPKHIRDQLHAPIEGWVE